MILKERIKNLKDRDLAKMIIQIYAKKESYRYDNGDIDFYTENYYKTTDGKLFYISPYDSKKNYRKTIEHQIKLLNSECKEEDV